MSGVEKRWAFIKSCRNIPHTTRFGRVKRSTRSWVLKLTIPTLLTAALWDQEDIYGTPAVYRAIHAADPGNPQLHLVIGPWFSHQERLDGSAIGPIAFGSDTAAYHREHILRPFFRRLFFRTTCKTT